MTVSFHGDQLSIGGHTPVLKFPIVDAFDHGDLTIVLFAPDRDLRNYGQFHNLVALNGHGALVWEAELPTTITGDCYYMIVNRSPLLVYSVQSYDVTLDADTGRILESQ